MNNVLGSALQQALDNKKNDFSNFIWKGEKKKDGDKLTQDVELIAEMTPERLQQCWDHCEKMLYNDDPKHLGRYNVLDEINEQINKCNVELFLRYYENTYKRDETRGWAIDRSSFNLALREFKANNPEVEDWTQVPITQIASNLPAEFTGLNIADVLDGCINYLGSFDKVHLTMTFITKMGLWFTKAEEGELKGETNSNTERLKVAKERLKLPAKLILRFSDKGLSYHEMRSMLILPKKQRYNDMTTEQLVTLSKKVLPRLQREIDGHIFSWRRLQRQIEIVARHKGITLNAD